MTAKTSGQKPASDGGPAFPDFEPVMYVTDGVSRAEAAIRLRVPDSGEEWLDDMIRKAVRRDVAAVMATAHAAEYDMEWAIKHGVEYADALIAALETAP